MNETYDPALVVRAEALLGRSFSDMPEERQKFMLELSQVDPALHAELVRSATGVVGAGDRQREDARRRDASKATIRSMHSRQMTKGAWVSDKKKIRAFIFAGVLVIGGALAYFVAFPQMRVETTGVGQSLIGIGNGGSGNAGATSPSEGAPGGEATAPDVQPQEVPAGVTPPAQTPPSLAEQIPPASSSNPAVPQANAPAVAPPPTSNEFTFPSQQALPPPPTSNEFAAPNPAVAPAAGVPQPAVVAPPPPASAAVYSRTKTDTPLGLANPSASGGAPSTTGSRTDSSSSVLFRRERSNPSISQNQEGGNAGSAQASSGSSVLFSRSRSGGQPGGQPAANANAPAAEPGSAVVASRQSSAVGTTVYSGEGAQFEVVYRRDANSAGSNPSADVGSNVGSSSVLPQGGLPLPSSVPADVANSPSSGDSTLVPGNRIKAKLATGFSAVEGARVPVVVESVGASWLGVATLDGSKRVQVVLDRLVRDGLVTEVSAVLLDKNGVVGLDGTFEDKAPSLAADVLRASLSGFNTYVQGLAQASRITYGPDGRPIQERQAPDLLSTLAGEVGRLFTPPSGNSLLRVVNVKPGTEVVVLVSPSGR